MFLEAPLHSALKAIFAFECSVALVLITDSLADIWVRSEHVQYSGEDKIISLGASMTVYLCGKRTEATAHMGKYQKQTLVQCDTVTQMS